MSKYYFNEHYFDIINNHHKAYWLGFIWADGYVSHRIRNNREEYGLKLSVQSQDYIHLHKFINDIDGNFDVKFYATSGYGNALEARVCIYKPRMPQTLFNIYDIKPHREKCTVLLSKMPQQYVKDFIRGLFDADGTFSIYQCQCNDGYIHNKAHITFGGDRELLKYIEAVLTSEGVVKCNYRKSFKRHKDRDGTWEQMRFSGNTQTLNILHWLYNDADIYLDRKYIKFMNATNKEGDNNAV